MVSYYPQLVPCSLILRKPSWLCKNPTSPLLLTFTPHLGALANSTVQSFPLHLCSACVLQEQRKLLLKYLPLGSWKGDQLYSGSIWQILLHSAAGNSPPHSLWFPAREKQRDVPRRQKQKRLYFKKSVSWVACGPLKKCILVEQHRLCSKHQRFFQFKTFCKALLKLLTFLGHIFICEVLRLLYIFFLIPSNCSILWFYLQ